MQTLEIPQAVRVDAGDGDALRGLRVLLVEDNDLNAEIAQFTLSRAGAVVTHARDGESAVEMFAASVPHEYDVVLMDIMMPGIDGLEATRQIRALDREDAATTPIIAVSANAFADDRRLSREAGMNAHLSKPVSSQELIEALCAHSRRRSISIWPGSKVGWNRAILLLMRPAEGLTFPESACRRDAQSKSRRAGRP